MGASVLWYQGRSPMISGVVASSGTQGVAKHRHGALSQWILATNPNARA